MGPLVHVRSVFEFCKFFQKWTSYQCICLVVKRQRQAPKQQLKPFIFTWCKITYKTGNGGSIQIIGTDDFIFRFDQRDSNSSLRFGQLTAKWLKSSVSDLQMKQRAPSVFESHGIPPLRPNCPMSLTCCCQCFTKSGYCSGVAQNCDGEIFERQLFAKFIRG